ncbi:MAG: TolC family protein, partial [Vulcanimicrobiaceae bacterium]
DDKQVAAAQVALDSAKSQVALDVRQDYRQAQTALAQIRYAREEARYGVESARIAKLQYQSGIVALTSVLEAEQTARSAQIDLFNARVGYVDAIVKLRVALGIYDAQSAVADLR